ncbi:hypothetical protein NCCP133_37280 [Cytobacillus sp. NCCP-133]|nr:hypothetical protein NCCP133_37280 [Cytobacillus sp. NCCP-133]
MYYPCENLIHKLITFKIQNSLSAQIPLVPYKASSQYFFFSVKGVLRILTFEYSVNIKGIFPIQPHF